MLNRGGSNGKPLSAEGRLGLLALGILLIGAVLWSARGPRTEKTDFSVTYMAATIVHRGQAAQLYDYDFQVQTRESLFHQPNPLLFEHPPFEALLLSPLANLSFRTAYFLWGVLNAAALLAVIFILRPYCPWPRQDLGYVSLWPLFAPLGVALFQGQSSLLVLAFFSAAFVQLQKDCDYRAGLVLGLGLLKLQLVLPFCLVFLFRRKWKFIAGFSTTALLLCFLSLSAVGFSGARVYAHFLSSASNSPRDLSYGSAVDMGSLYGLLFALLGRWFDNLSVSAITLAFSFLLLWLAARAWKDAGSAQMDQLGFATAVAVSLIAGVHMFTHDFSPLILSLFLAGAIFLARSERPPQTKALHNSVLIVLVLFWSFPLYFLLITWHALFLLCPLIMLFAFLAVRGAKYNGRGEQPATALATSG